MEFDIQDFERNPKKYEMFRTARIATKELPDFEYGEVVSITYLFNAQEDAIQGRIVPVYEVVSTKGDCAVHHLYANAFGNFVL